MPRPRSVTLLAVWVFCIAAFNTLGLDSGVRGYTVLSRLPLSLPPAVPIVSSAFWAVVFCVAGIGLWRLKPWARWGAPTAVTLYLAQFWIERQLFGQSDYLRMTIWFYLGFDALILVLVWGNLLRRKVRRAFSD